MLREFSETIENKHVRFIPGTNSLLQKTTILHAICILFNILELPGQHNLHVQYPHNNNLHRIPTIPQQTITDIILPILTIVLPWMLMFVCYHGQGCWPYPGYEDMGWWYCCCYLGTDGCMFDCV